MGYAGRDIEVVFVAKGWCLVVACDSCGAVGEKELDIIQASPYLVGRMTSRVALLEVLAVGAYPQVVSVSVSAEPNPTGDEILRGVRGELDACCGQQIPLVVSTEKNFPTRQTGVGISVTGTCLERQLHLGTSQPGDRLYCIGIPKVGDELTDPDDPDIVGGQHLRRLLERTDVHDVLPVGSQGIRREAERLAANVGTVVQFDIPTAVDLDKSAGPATCALFTSSSIDGFWGETVPIVPIGTLTTSHTLD